MKNMVAHVYAIIRIDFWFGDYAAKSTVSVKKIVWTREDAESEVERLNTLNSDKKCHYFWEMTRLEEKKSTNPENTEQDLKHRQEQE